MDFIADELAQFVGHWHDRFWRTYKKVRQQQTEFTFPIVDTTNFKTNASGLANAILYTNPSTRKLVIGRVILMADTYTPAGPYLGGYSYLYTGSPNSDGSAPSSGAIFDMLPNAAGGQLFPNVAEYSGHNAIRLKQNESLSLYVNGGPVSTNIVATFFGFLEPPNSDTDN